MAGAELLYDSLAMTSHAELAAHAHRSAIDRQYDTSLAVEDEASEVAHFIETATRARRTLKSFFDVSYGPTAAETLDIFPAAVDRAPVFVFFHGGYWRALSSKEFSGVALGLQPLGVTVVVVDYALCPEVDIDEITRQARAAVAWVRDHIGAYGGDGDRIAIGGHSAGGHLAAMCLLPTAVSSTTPVKCAALLSGLYDLEPLRTSYLQPFIRLDDGIIERNSPIRHVDPCPSPIRLTWGEHETREFERQSREFASSWAARGNVVDRLAPEAGANHFSVLHSLENADSDLCAWIAQRLESSRTP